jgi:hypothetical protein
MQTAAGGAYVRSVLGQWGHWTRKHLALTLLLSAAAFVLGWLWNTYIMAVDLEGSVIEPGQQTIATAQGQAGNGLFWLIFFSLLAGLITYGWQRGWRALFADLGAIPRTLAAALSASSGGAIALLLWGMSVSLIISTLISSAVSLALGVALLVLAASPLSVILNFALIRIWKGLCAIVAPQARHGSVLVVAPFMTMVGEALGLLADWLFNNWIIGLVVGVLCAVGSVLLSGKAWRPSTGTAALVLMAVGVGAVVLRARGAWADDGGWQECATSSGEPCSQAGIGGIFAWFGSEGSGVVMGHAAIGGASAGVGAAVGAGLGGAAAGLAGVGAASAASAASAAAGAQTEPPRAPERSEPHADEPATRSAAAATATSSSIPHQASASTADDHSGTPADPDATARLSAMTQNDMSVPQQAAAASIEDILPEPPDREEHEARSPDADATVRLSAVGPDDATVSLAAADMPIEDFLPEPPDRDDRSGPAVPPA